MPKSVMACPWLRKATPCNSAIGIIYPSPPHPWWAGSEELEQLGELLAVPAHRLITILGPGGIGKTRLALAAAAENAVGFRNGVLFVSLAGVSDVHFLPNAIIAALDTPLPVSAHAPRAGANLFA